ncbi:MAG TPA: glycosyltransferase [Gemmatimonadaceae bacterium]|nr:glycosyltransferase [Gemmatimonadaceae bacterium]
MATAVLQLDASDSSREIGGLQSYGAALILIRRGAVPVALFTLPVTGGRVDGRALRSAVAEQGGERLVSLEALENLGCSAALSLEGRAATVAVCTRDRPEDLDRCLTALRALASTGQELLVIDNASGGDGTRLVVDRHPGVRYVREDRPGLDIARNRALREARGEIVAFCDDDAVPDPHWLGALLGGFDGPRTLCVTGLTLPLELETAAQECFERTNAFSRGLDRRRFDGAAHDPFLVGRIGAGVNMALRKSVLDLIGPFDEALDAGTATKSGGDHDMFTRILLAGYCIVYEPGAISHHRHRRDWQGLRDTVRGYGTGVYAQLTKHLLEGREPRAIGIALGWGVAQLRNLLRSLAKRPDAPPLDLVLGEMRGCLAGPHAYRVAKRRLRVTSVAGTRPATVAPGARQ